jgi:hypothetical protein
MARSILLIFISGLFSLTVLNSCLPGKKFSHWDEKPVHSVYSGGHKWDITLTLYRDSTFRYVVRDDMLGIPMIKTGAYLKTDTSITLYRWQRKYLSRRSIGETFRIMGDEVLMFSEAREHTEDSSFIRDYFTLSLNK